MAIVGVLLALVTAVVGVLLAFRAADREPIPFEGEPVACESPERLRGGRSLPGLAVRVAAEVLGERATPPEAYAVAAGTGSAYLVLTTEGGAEIAVQAVDDPPCISSMSSPGLELTASSLASDVDGTLEVRLHDADLGHAELFRSGVAVTAGEPVELDLPDGVWAQATLQTADGTRLHALGPT